MVADGYHPAVPQEAVDSTDAPVLLDCVGPGTPEAVVPTSLGDSDSVTLEAGVLKYVGDLVMDSTDIPMTPGTCAPGVLENAVPPSDS